MSYRELAVVVWIIILCLWSFIDRYGKDRKNSIIDFLKSILSILNGRAFRFVEIYEIVWVIVLFIIFRYFNESMWTFKDYFISLFTAVFPILTKDYNYNFSRDYKQLSMDLFVWSGFSSFVLGQYTFPFIIEFLLIPSFVMLVLFAEFAKNSKIEYGKEIGQFVYGILGIIILGILVRDFTYLVHNQDIKKFDFWLSYCMPVLVFTIHLPFLMFWRWINMIDLQMQFFRKSSSMYYVFYLGSMFLKRLSLKKIMSIDWGKVGLKKESAIADRGYKIVLEDATVGDVKRIIKAVECMAAPKYIYKETECYLPTRIDVFFKSRKIAFWQDKRLEEDYKWWEDDFTSVGEEIYIDRSAM